MKTRTSEITNWHEAADYARFARWMMRHSMKAGVHPATRKARKRLAVYGFMLASGVGSDMADEFLQQPTAELFGIVYNEWKAGLHQTK